MKVAVQSLSKVFASGSQSTTVVDKVSFDVEDGEIVTLLGPSGCGKTTVLRMVAGLEEPSSGTIKIGDTVLNSPGVNVEPHKRGLGMVFQSYALWPHMTVAQNVSFPLEMQKLDKASAKPRIEEALRLVELESYASRYPHELSGGQQQRVALARAIVQRPQVLLLDEPLSNLDSRLREQTRNELKALHAKLKLTILYVTHDRLEALELSNRMAIMDQGKLIQLGTPEEIKRNPANEFVRHFVSQS